MATDKKAPTKTEFLEALKKNGINNLDDLVNAILPDTGGFAWYDSDDEMMGLGLVTIPDKGKFNLKWDDLGSRGFNSPDL